MPQEGQGNIQPSSKLAVQPHGFEVYGERGYAITTGGNARRVRLPDMQEEARTPEPIPQERTVNLQWTHMFPARRWTYSPQIMKGAQKNGLVLPVCRSFLLAMERAVVLLWPFAIWM